MKFLKVQWIIVLALALVLAACGSNADSSDDSSADTDAEITITEEVSTDDAETETEAEAEEETSEEDSDSEDSDNTYTVTGDLEFDIDGRSFAGDYSPISSSYDESAFQVFIIPESGNFPALTISGIPRDATAGTVIPLEANADTGVACLIFQPEIMGTSAVGSVSGELVLTSFDGENVSGTFEAMLSENVIVCLGSSPPEGDEGTVSVSGTFSGVVVPAEEE